MRNYIKNMIIYNITNKTKKINIFLKPEYKPKFNEQSIKTKLKN